jgi:hypothetical protein
MEVAAFRINGDPNNEADMRLTLPAGYTPLGVAYYDTTIPFAWATRCAP